jgi:hypothetical protein
MTRLVRHKRFLTPFKARKSIFENKEVVKRHIVKKNKKIVRLETEVKKLNYQLDYEKSIRRYFENNLYKLNN